MNNRESDQRLKKGNKNIYEMALGFINAKRSLSPEEFNLLVKVKYLSGESYYSSKELEFLRAWIQVCGVQEMFKFFTQYALKGQIAKTMEYQQSPLYRLFEKLTSGEGAKETVVGKLQ